MAGEKIVTVRSLDLPDVGATEGETLQAAAVRLFIDRACEADGAFTISADTPKAVAELCTRLDGIPLAIELAAARVRGMTPGEITSHLDRRFRLLTRGRRTATTRHQTLRNTIDWSYDLLDEAERTVLRRLAVFHGSFTLPAAEQVVADEHLDRFDVVDLVVRLVEKSLVVAETSSNETRYRLLETIRDYAWERLDVSGELDQVAATHARHFVEFAVRAGAELEGPNELEWRAAIERDVDNLRGALRWAIDSGDTDLALSEVEALAVAGALRTSPFGLVALEAAQMPGAEEHDLRPVALGATCMTYLQQGAADEAIAVAQAALDAAKSWGDSPRARKLRCKLSGCLFQTIAYAGDEARLLVLGRGVLDDARAIDDPLNEARALILLCSILGPEHHDEAVAYGQRAVALARRIGNPSYLAYAPMMLGGRLATTDPGLARELLDEAVTAAAAADNDFARNMAMQQLATAQVRQGDHVAASRTLLEMVRTAHRTGDHGTAHSGLATLACICAVRRLDVAALVAAAWLGDHGLSTMAGLTASSLWADFGIKTLLALHETAPATIAEKAAEQARSLDEAQLIEYVSAQLESSDESGPC